MVTLYHTYFLIILIAHGNTVYSIAALQAPWLQSCFWDFNICLLFLFSMMLFIANTCTQTPVHTLCWVDVRFSRISQLVDMCLDTKRWQFCCGNWNRLHHLGATVNISHFPWLKSLFMAGKTGLFCHSQNWQWCMAYAAQKYSVVLLLKSQAVVCTSWVRMQVVLFRSLNLGKFVISQQ